MSNSSETTVLKVGDFVYIAEAVDDDDFRAWEDTFDMNMHKVEHICLESQLVWLKDCPYAVPMESIGKLNLGE